MKIRNGFVSNSSSSSFVIITKNEGELNKKDLIDALGAKENTVMYKIAEEISDIFIRNSEEQTLEDVKNNYMWRDATMEEFKEDYPQIVEDFEKVMENNWKYYEGSLSSEEYGLESGMREMELDHEDENIKIRIE